MWKVNEIFCSLQGEGYFAGTPAVFIRFSGCNLRCDFCDTTHQSGTMMSLPQILEIVERHASVPFVVLTGGEPALQATDELIKALHLIGKRVAIETNGTRELPHGIDWVTLSPKCGFNGGDREPMRLTECDELKVVCLGQDLSQYDSIKAAHRFLQPCFVTDEKKRKELLKLCVDTVMANPGWRVSLQIHRVLGIP